MKNLRVLTCCLFLVVISSCNDEITPCSNEVAFEASNWEGILVEIEGQLAIRYHVPKTIDSFYTGIICNPDLIPEELQISSRITFSGTYFDDNGIINPSVVIGGEDFYFLKLGSSEMSL